MSFLDNIPAIPAGMSQMLIIMPAMYMTNQIDFKENQVYMNYLRVIFASVLSLTILATAFMYMKIKGITNDDKVRIVPVAPATGPTEVVTAQEHDLREAKKLLTSTAMSMVISGGINYKWDMAPPLVIQSLMGPKNFISSPLFQHYFLGKDIERPFAAEVNPLVAMMAPTPPAEAAGADGDATPMAARPKAVGNNKKKKSQKAD
jgi:hypothetical protein